MQKITPFLWFNNNAEEAAKFYTSHFKNTGIGNISHYDEESSKVSGMPEGSILVVEFTIDGYKLAGLNGGPIFSVNPSISFMLNFDPSKDPDAHKNLDTLWEALSDGGKVLMELGKYSFSEHYGWIQDKFGVSWQLILTDPKGNPRPFIVPSMLFVGGVCGRAEEAIDFYVSTFKNAKRGQTARYPAGMEPDKEGTLMFADFQLEDQWFAAMDSAAKHAFAFTEGVSFEITCKDQAEVDEFWDAFTKNDGEESVCGWCKDKFGVSWQINPQILTEMLASEDKAAAKRAMSAMLKMRKIDIAELQKAYGGE